MENESVQELFNKKYDLNREIFFLKQKITHYSFKINEFEKKIEKKYMMFF